MLHPILHFTCNLCPSHMHGIPLPYPYLYPGLMVKCHLSLEFLVFPIYKMGIVEEVPNDMEGISPIKCVQFADNISLHVCRPMVLLSRHQTIGVTVNGDYQTTLHIIITYHCDRSNYRTEVFIWISPSRMYPSFFT